MRYLCLVYFEEKVTRELAPSDLKTLQVDSSAYDRDLEKSGHYVAAHALEPVATATCVRVRNGKISTTDGPYAETREQLGGFILIEAKDLNDALQVAAKIPLAKLGTIEVRPVMTF